MRTTLTILAACLAVMGTIWILQGINILPGSFMTGQIAWAWRGAASVLAGILLFLYARRKP